jgi:hypothetical protein
MLDNVSGHRVEYAFSFKSIDVTFQPRTTALVHDGGCGLTIVNVPANREGEHKNVDGQSTSQWSRKLQQ